ncbi:silver-binding protein SilE [Edwardsiella tarda]|uniref:silver-binding protein SilE n=1 Tax=Edwardsiella tarda TaxID=636 RepID=UPI003D30297A
MKLVIYTTLFMLSISGANWANGTVDIHQQVDNAQAAAHQRLSSVPTATAPATGDDINALDAHQRAMIAHQAMDNGSASAHQQIIQHHQKLHDAEAQRSRE